MAVLRFYVVIVLEYQSSFANLGSIGEGEGCYHCTYLLLKLKFVINLGDQARDKTMFLFSKPFRNWRTH